MGELKWSSSPGWLDTKRRDNFEETYRTAQLRKRTGDKRDYFWKREKEAELVLSR